MFYRKPVVWNVMRVWESAHRVASLPESTKGKNGDNALTANAAWTFASSAIATFTAHGTAALFAKRAEWTALLERRKARRIWGDCSTRNTSINMPWEFIPRHTLAPMCLETSLMEFSLLVSGNFVDFRSCILLNVQETWWKRSVIIRNSTSPSLSCYLRCMILLHALYLIN